jgi:hypothetical protein
LRHDTLYNGIHHSDTQQNEIQRNNDPTRLIRLLYREKTFRTILEKRVDLVRRSVVLNVLLQLVFPG